jgi:hypothetical protein
VVAATCAAPFACGGNAFSTGSGGPGTDASADVVIGPDGAPLDSSPPMDGTPPGDAAPPPDAPGVDGAPPPADGGITISGTVVDEYLVPMAGVSVHAQLHSATTASDGTFALTDIVPPYDATVISTATGGHRHATVFLQATRPHPTFQLATDTAATALTTSVSGHLGANGLNLVGIAFADLAPGTPPAASNTIALASNASNYSGDISWFGSSQTNGTLYTLQYFVSNGVPSDFVAYNSQAETFNAGTAVVWNTPLTTTLGSGSISVSLSTPKEYEATALGMYVRPNGAQIAAPFASLNGPPLMGGTFPTPMISATFVACSVAVPVGVDGGPNTPYTAACLPGLAGSASAALNMPAIAALQNPPTSAGPGTVFAYSTIPEGLYVVAFVPVGATGTSGGDELFVVTTDPSVKVPDLSALGFSLAAGSTYAAEVLAFGPFSTIDSALSPAGFAAIATALHLGQGPMAAGQLTASGFSPFVAQ